MGFFISDTEIQELQKAPQNSKQQELYRIMKDRTERNTKEDCLVQSKLLSISWLRFQRSYLILLLLWQSLLQLASMLFPDLS